MVSQFDKDDVEAIGLVKFDFLGLRTLTIIDWAVRYVRELQQADAVAPFNIETIPLDDRATYDLLKACNTTAVFQLESRGMKDLIKRLQPDTFEDIVALVALFRPGPLESGMVEDFINRKHGRAKADYFHPELEVSLKPTYGVIVYQEQVMQISQIIGAYTLGGADMLRRAMGKKNPEEMAKHRDIFVNGAVGRGIDAKLATMLFDLMEKFAGYGFNKSHSAAYALVAYQTAYLKAHYPAAFMAGTLSADMDNTDKVRNFYQDTLQQGVVILPPNVNSSGYRFAPVDSQTIAYGLGAIKGTGEAAIASITAARQRGLFKDLFDFCRRVDKRIVNRRTVEALIKGGAFDCINDNRASMMATVDAALASADQQARAINQNSLFEHDAADDVLAAQVADVPRWSLREQLAQEKLSLGFYLSGHPYQEFAAEMDHFIKVTLSELTPAFVGRGNSSSAAGGERTRRPAGVAVVLAGIVAGVRLQQTRRGKMAVVTLDDGGAQIEMTVFNEIYERSRPWIKEDELLVVQGRASLDEYSGNVRVSADEVFDLASARSHYAQHLALRCQDTLSVEKLKAILAPYGEGKCPLLLHYRNAQASCQLRLGDHWRVTLHDDLLRDLHGLLGAENVRVVYD